MQCMARLHSHLRLVSIWHDGLFLCCPGHFRWAQMTLDDRDYQITTWQLSLPQQSQHLSGETQRRLEKTEKTIWKAVDTNKKKQFHDHFNCISRWPVTTTNSHMEIASHIGLFYSSQSFKSFRRDWKQPETTLNDNIETSLQEAKQIRQDKS